MAAHSNNLPGKSHGWRSLVGCSPWGREESDMTEQLQFHFHFSLLCIGEGNGNPLQCSCLENPTDGRACWAAVYGVAQSWTRLKRLSSSSSSSRCKSSLCISTTLNNNCIWCQEVEIRYFLCPISVLHDHRCTPANQLHTAVDPQWQLISLTFYPRIFLFLLPNGTPTFDTGTNRKRR